MLIYTLQLLVCNALFFSKYTKIWTKICEDNNHIFNYELFNRNKFNIRYWSWNYRGCWHQTCPPIDSWNNFYSILIPIVKQLSDAVISCHYLPMSGLGNLRACCLP